MSIKDLARGIGYALGIRAAKRSVALAVADEMDRRALAKARGGPAWLVWLLVLAFLGIAAAVAWRVVPDWGSLFR